MNLLGLGLCALALYLSVLGTPARADDGPSLIFRESTKFRLLTPNDKLATYAIDDPLVDGVACYYTIPEKAASRARSVWRKRRRTFLSPVASTAR